MFTELNNLLITKDEVETKLKQVNEEINQIAQTLIPMWAKYQVGDEIADKKNRFKISKITAGVYKRFMGASRVNEPYLSLTYYGHKILKSGTLHKTETELYWLSWDDYDIPPISKKENEP